MKAIEKRFENNHTMITLFTYLADKWQIGFISGIITYVLTTMQFLFEDGTLKIIGGIGLLMSIMVAFLSIVTGLLKLYDDLTRRYSIWKEKRAAKRAARIVIKKP